MSTQNSSSNRTRIISTFGFAEGSSTGFDATVRSCAVPEFCISKVARKSDSADMPMISRWILCWRVVKSYGVEDGRSCEVSAVDGMVALSWVQR